MTGRDSHDMARRKPIVYSEQENMIVQEQYNVYADYVVYFGLNQTDHETVET
jgi:hypothetical protein